LTKNAPWIDQLVEDYRAVDLSAADRAMLDYGLKLTEDPASLKAEDVQRLRDNGFDDRSILDINLVTGYYAFVNRLADGLGVPLEDFWD